MLEIDDIGVEQVVRRFLGADVERDAVADAIRLDADFDMGSLSSSRARALAVPFRTL
jgi:hypothetical protein